SRQRQMRPQRHGRRGERYADTGIAARRKRPIQGYAHFVEVRPVGSEPFRDGPRLELRLGTLGEVSMVLGVTPREVVEFSALGELVARVGASRLEEAVAQNRVADIGRQE